MTYQHITDLHFSGRRAYADKRIRKLKVDKFLIERPRRLTDPAVLSLSKKGYEALLAAGELGEQYPELTWPQLERRVRSVSERGLRHELKVMDVKCAFNRAIAAEEGLSIVEFSTWPLLYEFSVEIDNQTIPMQPDGFIRLHDARSTEEMTYFLEVDLSSMVQTRLAAKMVCYRQFYQSGDLAERFGFGRDPTAVPMIVLLIVPNDERRNNAAEKLLQLDPPIMRQVWMTTLPEALKNPLDAIWVRPKDYLAVVKDTPFDPARQSRGRPYITRPERERMVASSIAKHRLLADVT
jgi:hypothetical protein